jgi:uncharacterized protein
MMLTALVLSAVLAALPAPVSKLVSVPVAGGTIAGTLTVPNGKGPFPVALVIAGSGGIDRDCNELPYLHTDAYKKLADGLAASGIATLRYDKRGVGESLKVPETSLRFDDYVRDALALTAWLEKDPRFSKVTIIGHSEGSLIGILAAQRDPRISAIVSLEGAGRDLATIIEEQARSNSANPPQLIAEIVSYDASLRAGKAVPSPDPQLAELFRPSVQPYLMSEYTYDPAKEIAKLAIPVLVIHGTTDIQVSDVDARDLAAAYARAKLVSIEGMNHALVDAPAARDANIATYSQPALPLSADLVPAIAGFLR